MQRQLRRSCFSLPTPPVVKMKPASTPLIAFREGGRFAVAAAPGFESEKEICRPLGNLLLETSKNKSVDYEYNELNQLVRKTTSNNKVFTYTYDARGNCAGAERRQQWMQSFGRYPEVCLALRRECLLMLWQVSFNKLPHANNWIADFANEGR